MLNKSGISPDIQKRCVSLLIEAFIFFACCYSAVWWDYLAGWSLILMLCILILFFWMFYQLIFEIAVLIRDRRALKRYHFIPITIVILFWIIVIAGFFTIFESHPLGNDDNAITSGTNY